MNRITLQPGEALYMPPGNLHAYLSGGGVEIMANSDNVMRGGLTPKYVNVDELLAVLDFTPGFRGLITPSRSRGESGAIQRRRRSSRSGGSTPVARLCQSRHRPVGATAGSRR